LLGRRHQSIAGTTENVWGLGLSAAADTFRLALHPSDRMLVVVLAKGACAYNPRPNCWAISGVYIDGQLWDSCFFQATCCWHTAYRIVAMLCARCEIMVLWAHGFLQAASSCVELGCPVAVARRCERYGLEICMNGPNENTRSGDWPFLPRGLLCRVWPRGEK